MITQMNFFFFPDLHVSHLPNFCGEASITRLWIHNVLMLEVHLPSSLTEPGMEERHRTMF